ncbi:MAG: bifunctional precorrin-2 dehydrogenase/sirohydrochlorin ferrochelatase [Polyangiaceae bacterium]|jgi:uroporphyrin-III C-methyltransferase/precorrin-2 dehydrogenase/sirohydrochlorin ferrochelatase
MPDAAHEPVYPIFLKLAGRQTLVVGAGSVAERKVASLVEAGALVTVVAPTATPQLTRLAAEGMIEWHARRFRETDLDGAWLVIASTSDPEAQMKVAEGARARHIFVVAVDDPANSSAYSGAIMKRPPFTVAISSAGTAPALTRLLRELLEYILPDDDWVEHARALRAQWMTAGTPMSERFGELVRELAARRK